MHTSRTFRILGAVLAALAAGCQEDDWGEKAAKFVDEEVPELSRSLAQAELSDRWEESVRLQHAAAVAQMQTYRAVLAKVEVRAPDANAKTQALEQYLRNSEATLTMLDDLQGEIEHSEANLRGIAGACEARNIFESLQLEQTVRRNLMNVVLPTPDYSLQVSFPDAFPAIMNMMTGNFLAARADRQNELFSAARSRVTERVVRGQELFDISKAACLAHVTKYAETTKVVAASLEGAAGAVRVIRQAVVRGRLSAGKQYLDLVAQDLMDQNKLASTLNQSEEQLRASKLLADLLTIRHELAIRDAVTKAGDCVDRLIAIEASLDAHREALVQVDGFTGLTGDDRLEAALKAQKTRLEDREKALSAELEKYKAGKCTG